MATAKNRVFEFSGINHLALVCKDMARTVEFYSNVLGMPLIKTLDLPHGFGQHFFFGFAGIDAHAGGFGKARGLLAARDQHGLSNPHQPDRDARRFARHRIPQVDARIHGRGVQPELALL